ETGAVCAEAFSREASSLGVDNSLLKILVDCPTALARAGRRVAPKSSTTTARMMRACQPVRFENMMSLPVLSMREQLCSRRFVELLMTDAAYLIPELTKPRT